MNRPARSADAAERRSHSPGASSAAIARAAAAASSAGKYVAASPLHFVSSAKSVRIREGKPSVTDGPFAETREQLGGYYIVDVKNIEEAVAIAKRIPPATKGTIEVRPVMEIPGLPTED